MKKRLFSILLLCFLLLSLLSVTALAEGESTSAPAAIQNGIGSITGYDTEAKTYDYIYYGVWNNKAVKWRVLDTKANTGAADALFLLTDECLYPLPGDLYDCYIQFNPANKSDRHLWKDSTLQDWFKNTFYSGENSAFTSAERALIPATTQAGSVYEYKAPNALPYFPPMRFQTCALEAEHVFAPSIQDIMNAGYGFIDSTSRIAGPINSRDTGTQYWLRSFEMDDDKIPFMVGEDASLMGDYGGNPAAVRPAMNLSTAGNNILFISAAEGGKPAGGLTEIGEYAGNEWKLTLLDSSRSGFAVTTTDLSAYTRGGTVKIGYTGAKTGTNEYVSAMILDAAGNPAYYGRSSAALTDENGTAELTIPALAKGTYTLKVYNEQYNGDKMTDLASEFHDVTLNVQTEEQFPALTPGGKYYFDLSEVDMPGETLAALPDNTMHYVPFTYAGTVDAYSMENETDTAKQPYEHSLFIADYNVKNYLQRETLAQMNLIYGQTYTAGNVNYTLRAPSIGDHHRNEGEGSGLAPIDNEWDTIYQKSADYIKNWNGIFSYGQDTGTAEGQVGLIVVRGKYFATDCTFYALPTMLESDSGFRPVLELPAALKNEELKVVSLELNGGSIGEDTTANIVVKNGESFTAPGSTGLTRPADNTGTDFWWLGSDGQKYLPGEAVSDSVTSLTAQWTPLTYNVTLETNGGTIVEVKDVTTYIYGETTTLPTADNITKTGYTFRGWYTESDPDDSAVPVTEISPTERGDKTFYAKWTVNSYTITFDTAGGSYIAPITQDYGTDIIAPADPTKTGYTFTGWTPAIPATMPAENTEIKANWSVISYSISYDLSGGTVSGNPDSYDIETETFTLNNPTRTGYTFTGWSEAGKTGTEMTVTIEKGSTGNREYTANWSCNTYSITYDLDGGTAIGNPDSYSVESDAITLNAPERPLYIFTGWSGTDLEGEDNLTVTIPAGSTGDRSYTAHWRFNASIIAAIDSNPGSGFGYGFGFLDVSRADWYYNDVRYVCENGLMNGTSRNQFTPDGAATRGMLVTILYRLENEPNVRSGIAFSDVKPGAYYEDAVDWASFNGIVSGYTDGTFRPDEPVSREQLAAILYRYTQYRGYDVSEDATSLTGYTDANTVSNYALPAMRWASGMEIIQGANGRLNPSAFASRAQLAAMLHRYLTK